MGNERELEKGSRPKEENHAEPAVHRPMSARARLRQAQQAAALAAIDRITMVDFDEREAGTIEVGRDERLPGGGTRADQLRDNQDSETEGQNHVRDVLTDGEAKVRAGLDAFNARIAGIIVRAKDDAIPGAPFLDLAIGQVWSLLKQELPILGTVLATELPFLGTVSEVAGAAGKMVQGRGDFDIAQAGKELVADTSRKWSVVVTASLGVVHRFRKEIHSVYAQAKRFAPGREKEDIIDFLDKEVGLRKLPNDFADTLAAALANRLDDAIRLHKCQDSTLYQMAHGAACATEDAPRRKGPL